MIALTRKDCVCSISEFYENVAQKLGIKAVQFNCSKIRVTRSVQDAIWSYYKDTIGANDADIAMLWVDIGPKADLDGNDYHAEAEDGFAVVSKFSMGDMVMTCGISDRMNNDENFVHFIAQALGKYMLLDWGEMCAEDKALNNRALLTGDRLHGAYIYPKTKETVWIITEADRSVTTILFPNEY